VASLVLVGALPTTLERNVKRASRPLSHAEAVEERGLGISDWGLRIFSITRP
jgi:hypothetical protein